MLKLGYKELIHQNIIPILHYGVQLQIQDIHYQSVSKLSHQMDVAIHHHQLCFENAITFGLLTPLRYIVFIIVV